MLAFLLSPPSFHYTHLMVQVSVGSSSVWGINCAQNDGIVLVGRHDGNRDAPEGEILGQRIGFQFGTDKHLDIINGVCRCSLDGEGV